MSKEWKAAQVKFVTDQGYGFLHIHQGDYANGRVFFHKAGYFQPGLVLHPAPHIGQFPTLEATPRPEKDDWIIYEEGKNEKGVIAVAWCFRRDWNKIQQQIKELPRYRVVYRHVEHGQPEADHATRSWIEKSVIRETIYEPTYDLEVIASLLDYKGNQMMRYGQFQLQVAKTGDNWEVAPLETTVACYHRFFADNSLWNYKPNDVVQKKVA